MILDEVETEIRKKPSFNWTTKRDKSGVVSRNSERQQVNTFINENNLKHGNQFKYFVALISTDGRNNTEISSRIAQARMSFQTMTSVPTNAVNTSESKQDRVYRE